MPDSSENEAHPHNPQATAPEAQPILNVPTLVVVLIVVLVAIHLIISVFGPDMQIWALYAFSFIPLRLAGDAIAAPQGAQLWSFLTHGFLHGSWLHLGTNCLWLLIFATPVTRRLGNVRTLVLLAVSVIAGAAAMLPGHWGEFLTMVGASGAVSGAMAASIPIMFAPNFRRGLADLAGVEVLSPSALIRNGSAVSFSAVFFVLQIFTGATQAALGTAYLNESVVAWEAHLGGFVAGLAAFYILDRKSAGN